MITHEVNLKSFFANRVMPTAGSAIILSKFVNVPQVNYENKIKFFLNRHIK